MAPRLFALTETRESILSQIERCVEYVSTHCYYCKNCWECKVTSRLQKQSNIKGLKTFNRQIKWWSIAWVDYLPVLKPQQ